MHRRDFLRFAGLSTSGLVLPSAVTRAFAQSPTDRWRTFEVTTRVEVLQPAGKTRVWLPTPLTVDTPYQKSLGSTFNAEGADGKAQADPAWGLGMVWAEWAAGAKPVLTLVSRFATRDVAVDLAQARARSRPTARSSRATSRPPSCCPTDGIVKATAMDITQGREGRPREGARHLRLDRATTPSATPRRAAAARATSSTCSRRRTSAASAPT